MQPSPSGQRHGKHMKVQRLPRDLVHLAARVLDTGDAALDHERLVRGFPVGEVLERIVPVLLFPLLYEVRVCGAKPVVDQFGGDGVVVGLAAVGHHLDLLVHQPLRAFLVDAAAVGEVLVGVGPLVVEAGVDDDDVAFLDLGRSVLQVLGGDDAPLLLGDRHADPGAEQTPQRIVADGGGVLGHVQRRVHVGAAVHDAFPLHLVDAVLGVELVDGHIHARGRGPLGHELRERVGEVIYLEAHGWFLSAPRVISYRARCGRCRSGRSCRPSGPGRRPRARTSRG